MKTTILTIAISVVLTHATLAQSPMETKAFQLTEIVLYNPVDVFEERSPTAAILASFINKLEAKAATLWKDAKPVSGKSGFIAVAIRPDRTMKLWVDVEEAFQSEITASLEREMNTIGVPKVKNGPIAFAVHFDLWGGSSKSKVETGSVQIPQLWRRAAEAQSKSLVIPDNILPLVWKAEPTQESESKFFIPEGYDLQELKPTGGKIPRPKGWFYAEDHSEHAFMWTISKEDPKKGSYETGVRIQCFAGVQEITGKSPREFVLSFVEGKSKASKVISRRPEQTQGLFTRIGIEIEETVTVNKKQTTYRMLYSCFWGNEVDMVTIVTSGTTPDLWGKYTDAFDIMGNFDLIDMKKYVKDRTKVSHEIELPDPPKGYIWKYFSEAHISCLCPEGWNYKSFKGGDTITCTISPEETKSGQGINIGLSIHMIKNVTKKTKVPAETYATHYLANYVPEDEFISFSEPQDHGKLQLRLAEVIRKKDDMRIALRTYANKETDTLFIVTFGTPTDKWEAYSPYKLIFEYMVLDDEI